MNNQKKSNEKKFFIFAILLASLFALPSLFNRTLQALTSATVTFGESGQETYSNITSDSYINTSSQTSNYGANSELWVHAGGNMKTLIKFDLSQIPQDATIDSAVISMYLGNVSGDPGAISFYRLLKNWTEGGATWSSTDGSTLWSTAGTGAGNDYNSTAVLTQDPGTAIEWKTFDITNQVQNWTAGAQANYGLMLVAPASTAALYRFSSSENSTSSQRPKLTVTYTTNTTPPLPDTASPTIPTNLTATTLSSAQISLSWTASTDDTAVSGYNIYRNSTQITTTTTNTSYIDTGLSPSTTYSYTVSAYDAVPNTSAQTGSVSAMTQAAASLPAGIIFEDDFSDDAGWVGAAGSSWQISSKPTKWTAFKRPSNSTVEIESGSGQNGTPALKLGYQINSASAALSLGKHLTGNQNAGYDEVYVRYQVRFDNNWRVGFDGTDFQSWKWMRLWQYRDPSTTSNWSENYGIKDTRYIILNMQRISGANRPGWNADFSDNINDDSNGGALVQMNYYPYDGSSTGGSWDAIPEWEIQQPPESNPGMFRCYPNCQQGWHTVEWHIKLSNDGLEPGDGVYELWLDGVKQKTPPQIRAKNAMTGTWTGVPTMAYQGGINWITVFDNNQTWSEYWNQSPAAGVKFIYVDNVVVSNDYIGPNYLIGDNTTSPTIPTNLTATALSSSQISLSWTASTDDTAVSGYNIYRNGTQITTTANTSYTDTGLSPSTTYSYTVSAYDAVPNTSAQTGSVSAMTQAAASLPAGIIFEDDFSDDAGWTATQSGFWRTTNKPSKWDAYLIQPNSSMSIESNLGHNGTPALKIGWPITTNLSNAMTLSKHLTGDKSTGYSTLYIRYRVKFDNYWRYGDGCQDILKSNSCGAWKWGRVRMNINPGVPSSWGSNYVDGDNGQNGQEQVIVLQDPSAGEGGLIVPTWKNAAEANWHLTPNYNGTTVKHASNARNDRMVTTSYGTYTSGSGQGHLWSDVPEWEFDTTSGTGEIIDHDQDWHTVEFYFKLNTMETPPGNGEFGVFVDGIEQTKTRKIVDWYTGASEPGQPALGNACSGNNCWKTIAQRALLNETTPGGGMNFLLLFDNMRNITYTWDNQKYFYVDDVVVSTNYIGKDYEVGTPPPTCTSFTYSTWSECQSDGTQTRTITSSSPSGCTGGIPDIIQSCVYIPPPTTSACSDGADNDSDGLIDYGTGPTNDPGCSSTTDDDEYNLPADSDSPTISTPNISVSTTTAIITFTTNEAAGVYIDYGLSITYGSQTNTTQNSTSFSFTLSNLSADTIYHYRITATDNAGNQTQLLSYTFTTDQATQPDTTSPAQITDLASSNITQTSATFSWTAVGDDGNTGQASGYDLRYSPTILSEQDTQQEKDNWWSSAAQATGEPTPKQTGQPETQYISVGLSPSTTYYFGIKALDEVPNISPLSNIAQITTLDTATPPPSTSGPSAGPTTTSGSTTGGSFSDTTPPASVDSFITQPADSQITLSWNNPKDNDFVRVKILRTESLSTDDLSCASSPDSANAEAIYEGNNEEYTDISLNNDSVYCYSIFAYDQKPNYSLASVQKTSPLPGQDSISKTTANIESGDKSAPLCSLYTGLKSLFGLTGEKTDEIAQCEAETTYGHSQFVQLDEDSQNSYDKLKSRETEKFTDLNILYRYSIAYFIHTGTPTTKRLGAGERAGVINSYWSAFNKLPSSTEDWQDIIKIANGRWPTETNTPTEDKAASIFQIVYLREPNRDNPNDDAAVTIISYGLRPADRNLDSERAAIIIFKNIYGYNPSSATDWDTVRAIAYSGAIR